MILPVGYDNNLERKNTHHDFLPKGESLETTRIKRSMIPSSSVLGVIKIQSRVGLIGPEGGNLSGMESCGWRLLALDPYYRNRYQVTVSYLWQY